MSKKSDCLHEIWRLTTQEGLLLDGGDIQNIMERHGVAEKTSKPCKSYPECYCADIGDHPECYQFLPDEPALTVVFDRSPGDGTPRPKITKFVDLGDGEHQLYTA